MYFFKYATSLMRLSGMFLWLTACHSGVEAYNDPDDTSQSNAPWLPGTGYDDTASDGTGTNPGGSTDAGGTDWEWSSSLQIHAGLYATMGDWHGYIQSVTDNLGTTVNTAAFSENARFPLCIAGEVIDSYSGHARIQVHLNQAQGADTPAQSASISGTGISVTVDNRVTTPLKLLLIGADGTTEWCVGVLGTGGTYSWSEFNTECNNPALGTFYNGEPLTAIALSAFGVPERKLSYDFCLQGMTLVNRPDTDPEPIDTGTEPESPSLLCVKHQVRNVSREGVDYLVLNNVWNTAAPSDGQCIEVLGTSFKVTKQTNHTGGNVPMSYPCILYGAKSIGQISRNAELPKQVSALGNVTTLWHHNAGTPSGTYNASYDVWFNTSTTIPSNPPNGAYLMLWHHHQGSIQPAGQNTGLTVNIAGITWRIWTGGTGETGVPYIAYQATQRVTNSTVNLRDFINDAVNRGVIQNSWYLANVQAGFEIWSGGVNLETYDFYVSNL